MQKLCWPVTHKNTCERYLGHCSIFFPLCLGHLSFFLGHLYLFSFPSSLWRTLVQKFHHSALRWQYSCLSLSYSLWRILAQKAHHSPHLKYSCFFPPCVRQKVLTQKIPHSSLHVSRLCFFETCGPLKALHMRQMRLNSLHATRLYIGARVPISLREAPIYRLIAHTHQSAALRERKLPITVP